MKSASVSRQRSGIRRGVFALAVLLHALQPTVVFAEPAVSEATNKTRLQEVLESWFPTLGGEAPPEGSPTTFGDETSAMMAPSDILSTDEFKSALPWRAPTFGRQVGALGWSETAFEVPPKMRERVDFWKDIYAKYSTEKGVLHDAVMVWLVYTPIDFTPIMHNSKLSSIEKAQAREALVDKKRLEVTTRLLKLANVKSADGLTGEDLRIWKLFEKINDPDKFKAAAQEGRVRFQLGQKDRFLMGIYQSGRYLRKMEEIFREAGLPMELTRLPFVESSFNVNARSKVGASGIWQFMPRTAKQYMKVTKEVDERNDPVISTQAAARLLKQNFLMFDSWALALTGYNHGAYGVKSIVEKLGTRDIAEIIERYSSPSFGVASQNFFACFLAALEVERNASSVFSEPRWSPELEHAEFKSSSSAPWNAFREFFDGDENLAMKFNPHLTSAVREGHSKIPSGTTLRVPPNRLAVAEQFFKGKFPASKIAQKLKDFPMPANFDSAGSVLRAARSSIRQRIMQPLQTSEILLPEILALTPIGAQNEKAPFTPATEEPAPLSLIHILPSDQRTNGVDNP